MMKFKGTALAASAALALVLAAPVGADMTTTKTTTTSYSGTISELQAPSKTFVIRSESSPAPMTYSYNEKTVWVDSAGNTVSMEAVKNQPATVHYVKDGDAMVVTRVEVQKPAATIEKKTTTTTTEELH